MFRLSLLLILVGPLPDSALGQRLFEKTNNEEIDFFITFDGGIQFATTFQRTKKLRGEKRWLNILTNEKILSDVDGTKEQRRKLETLLKKAKTLKNEILERNEINPFSEVENAQLNKKLSSFHDVQQEIEELLVDHQKKRLHALLVRRDIQLVGLPNALMEGLIKVVPELTFEQIKQIKSFCGEEKQKFVSKLNAMKEKYVELVIDELDKEQSAKLFARVPKKFLTGCVVFSVEQSRIDHAVKLDKRLSKWSILGADQVFNLDSEGRLVAGKSRFPLPVRALHALHQEIQATFLSDLQLTETQIDAFTKSTEKYLDFDKKYFEKIRRDRKQNDGKNRKQIIADHNKLTIDFCRQAISKFEASLSSAQKLVSDRLLDQIGVSKLGLVGWIISKHDGFAELKLSTLQRKSIQSLAEYELGRILVECQNLETGFESKLLSLLSRDQRTSVRALVGKPLKNRLGQPELHFRQLHLAETRKIKKPE